VPNDHKIDPTFPLFPKYTKVGIFGLQIYHPATLLLRDIVSDDGNDLVSCKIGVGVNCTIQG
jgi:hypothetical protein